MGVYLGTSACFCCKRPFTYNPMRVPSIPADVSGTGTREPVCLGCVNAVNPQRIANGLPPIVPLPGAYEACDESEMVWD